MAAVGGFVGLEGWSEGVGGGGRGIGVIVVVGGGGRGVGCGGAEVDAAGVVLVHLLSLCRFGLQGVCWEERVESLGLLTYHNGHVPLTLSSQGSTHSGWNLWLHGSTRMSWPFSKSSVQMEHPRPSSALVFAAATAAPAAGAIPEASPSP